MMITARIPGIAILKRRLQSLLQLLITSSTNFRYGTALFSVCFIFGLNGTIYELLAPTSSDIFALRLWKLVGGFLVEPNIFVFLWSVVAVYQFNNYIEPAWGALEILKYIYIVQLITTLSIAIFALFCFAAFQALNFFFYVPICGLSVVGISGLVSLKQFLPDTVVLTTPYGRLKNGHLPLTAFLVSIFFWLLRLLRGGVPLQIAVGLQVAWIYLRFFRVSGSISLLSNDSSDEQNRIIGDESEHFTWASFFPRRLQPFAGSIGNAAFRVLVSLRICKRLKDLNLDRIDEALQSTLSVVSSGAHFESRDAERKRQRALRMLNECLSSVVSSRDGSAPGMSTSVSSPRLPSAFISADTMARTSSGMLRRDSSADETTARFVLDGTLESKASDQNADITGIAPYDKNIVAVTPRSSFSAVNEHLYGMATNSSASSLIADASPSKLLARMDSQSAECSNFNAKNERVQATLDSSESDDEEGAIR